MKMERPDIKSVKNHKHPLDLDNPILKIEDLAEEQTPIPTTNEKVIHQPEADIAQIPLNIEDTSYKIKQKVSIFKIFLKKRKELLEFSPNWRAPWLPLTLVFTVINFLLLSFGLVFLYQTKKTIKLPFIYDPVDRTWYRNDIIAIFIISTIYLLISYLIIVLSRRISKFDRRLSSIINVLLFFINILFNIGIIQIFLLIS